MGRASTMMRKLRDVHLWYTSPNSLEGSDHLRCASLDFFAFKLIYLFTCISLIVILCADHQVYQEERRVEKTASEAAAAQTGDERNRSCNLIVFYVPKALVALCLCLFSSEPKLPLLAL